MSASFTAAVVKGITSRVEYLFKNNEFCGDKLVLAGGVAANSHLREALLKLCNKYGIEFFCPPLSLCGDNAVMIGCQGYYEFINGKDKNFNDLSLNAYASSEF
jgi:N6-L-threonylcarbamoyladenine synthase